MIRICKSVTSSEGKPSKSHRGPTCGITIVTRTTITRLIAEQFLSLRVFEAKAGPRKKSLAFILIFEEINELKGS
jgi:hypothetical protein